MRRRKTRTSLAVLTVLGMLVALLPLSAVSAGTGPTVFINEIHYDNTGTDSGEAIEIAGPAGTDLSGWSIVLYNGNGGAVYNTTALGGTIPDQSGGYGTVFVSYPTNGIQNGSPDGVALVDDGANVVQFLSYEGTFSAAGGPADGMSSDDIGVSESSDTPVGNSLFLSGEGTTFDDFSWNAGVSSFGVVNAGQTFGSTGTPGPVINEFSASTTGTDVEYVEVFGDPDTDYSALTVLEVEGDSTGAGVIDEVIAVGTTDSLGFWLADLPANSLENGTLSLLLVEGFTGTLGDDLDPGNDGTFDITPWDAVVDSVSVWDGGSTDVTYGVPTLGPNYDGVSSFAPGGASRIPDGNDTNAAADWVRNDFDLAGIPGYEGSISLGEAYNTPGTANEIYVAPPEACGDPFTPIYSVQGSGSSSPLVGTEVAVEGVVVGDFQNNDSDDSGELNGFHVQDPVGDGDGATSDGVFIYAPGGIDVAVGDAVRVRGPVSEFFGLTEISASQIWICSTGHVVTPTAISLPVGSADDFEAFEGMLVTFPQSLYISEFFNFDRFGEIVLTNERQFQPTQVFEPGSSDAIALAEANTLGRITLDDGRGNQNPDPAIHPNGLEFTLTNRFRGGDTVTNVTGVMDYAFSLYRIQPTQGADYESINPRTAAPDLGDETVRVAAFNVLNFFTHLDDGTNDICGPLYDAECRGADTAEEYIRQRDKIVAGIVGLDADVVGLMEIENDIRDDEPVYPNQAHDPVIQLVAALNVAEAAAGSGFTWDWGVADYYNNYPVRNEIIYRSTVTPLGPPVALQDLAFDGVRPQSNGDLGTEPVGRPPVAQSFADANGEVFTVVANHFKSKGSGCDDGVYDPVSEELLWDDPGFGDLYGGNCNYTRVKQSEALMAWLATDPTGSNDSDVLIIGDLNSYAMEDPIAALEAGGFTNLLRLLDGPGEYTYVFNGQLGNLDHALGSPSIMNQVTGTAAWHINSDEPDILDYDMSFKQDAQDDLYEPNAYRASDHDPVIVGLDLNGAADFMVDTDPASLWPPNHKYREVMVSGSDADGDLWISILDAASSEMDCCYDEDDLPDDIVITGAATLDLRAERYTEVDGRIYTVTVYAWDGDGQALLTTVYVHVPHDQRDMQIKD